MRRRAILLLVVMATVFFLASGTALAALKIGTDGPDTLIGTSSADQITGRGGNDTLKGLAGNDVYYFEDGWGDDTLEEPRKVGKKSRGSDTLSFSRTLTDVTVYLIRQWGPAYNRAYTLIGNPDGATRLQQVSLGTSVVENAAGGVGSDYIHGGGERNTLQPGAGTGNYLWDYGGMSASTFLNPNQPGLPASNIFKGFELNSGNDYVYDFAGTADVLDLRPFSSSGVYIDAVDLDSGGDRPDGIEEEGRSYYAPASAFSSRPTAVSQVFRGCRSSLRGRMHVA